MCKVASVDHEMDILNEKTHARCFIEASSKARAKS